VRELKRKPQLRRWRARCSAGRVKAAIGQLQGSARLAANPEALKTLGRIYYRRAGGERRPDARAEVAPADLRAAPAGRDRCTRTAARGAGISSRSDREPERPSCARQLARLQPEDVEHIRAALKRRAKRREGEGTAASPTGRAHLIEDHSAFANGWTIPGILTKSRIPLVSTSSRDYR
jgi:hypothetical protein